MIQCPGLYVTRDVTLAIYAARQAEQGRWPVAGGWLDQTQKCLDAIEYIRREEADWKRRREQEQ